jgi:hypothetical protein
LRDRRERSGPSKKTIWIWKMFEFWKNVRILKKCSNSEKMSEFEKMFEFWKKFEIKEMFHFFYDEVVNTIFCEIGFRYSPNCSEFKDEHHLEYVLVDRKYFWTHCDNLYQWSPIGVASRGVRVPPSY